ncbi:ribosome hibernation-promoting factor, HPF/YfiA family [Candidatus Magnetominusculus dajiuhuensis]|uniref:ribosome hibernation-promoting factor, HPF/YfiA family n=1 Tax=Candidatus Magnetominusculus dajiuhuensis TaxID=3137712 RepID=UPI003B43BCCE
MNITVTGRNFEITTPIRAYADGKISKFGKFLSADTDVLVILAVEKYRHKAEVVIKSNGIQIQAESITGEIYASIDEVIEKLDRQIKKYKEKITSKRKGAVKCTHADTASAAEHISIIKRKQFDMKPMAAEEAAMHMDLLDKDFYVFTNEQSGEINVIYKIEDGDLGLIEPVK